MKNLWKIRTPTKRYQLKQKIADLTGCDFAGYWPSQSRTNLPFSVEQVTKANFGILRRKKMSKTSCNKTQKELHVWFVIDPPTASFWPFRTAFTESLLTIIYPYTILWCLVFERLKIFLTKRMFLLLKSILWHKFCVPNTQTNKTVSPSLNCHARSMWNWLFERMHKKNRALWITG
jgi:hypothetical protein